MGSIQPNTLAPAARFPPLEIPAGDVAVTVKIINSTNWNHSTQISRFIVPDYDGFELYGVALSFFVEHKSPDGRTRRLLFDLGMRKDWRNLAPAVMDFCDNADWTIHTEKNVVDILVAEEVDPASIGAVIWSHWHFDHSGDPSSFPPNAALVVGPGFSKSMLPGYPANPESMILGSDYTGRTLREIDFHKDAGGNLKIGPFDALDYFGDGSFYLLDAPGHAIGHVCGLARTTVTPATFILMGADACHHGSELRPSRYNPLPKMISPSPLNPRPAGTHWPNSSPICPGELFLDIHRNKCATEPFTEPTKKTKPGAVFDESVALD